MDLKFIEHLLEYLHALLMPVVNLRQKREIIGCVLVKGIVLYDNHLQLFHIEACVHLDRALVNKVYYHRLFLELLRGVR